LDLEELTVRSRFRNDRLILLLGFGLAFGVLAVLVALSWMGVGDVAVAVAQFFGGGGAIVALIQLFGTRGSGKN
jgi:hypothetical protein